MKQLFNISSETAFYMTLGFLLLVPFSIAACYILYTVLLIQLIVFSVKAVRHKKGHRENTSKQSIPLAQSPVTFPPMPGYYKYLMLYFPATLLSTLFSLSPWQSFKDNKEFFVFLLIPLFLLVLNTRKRLEQALTVVLISAVGSALLGIFQGLSQGISLDHRLKGLTSHWMTFSGLLMFPFIFFFIYLFYEKRKKIRILIGLALVPVMAAIFLSLTRSVWVGIIIALTIFIIYYKPRILYFIIPIALILAFILPSSVKNRAVSIFDIHNATNQDRIYMAQIAVNIFKDYPLTGVGPNCIEKVYNDYKPAGATQTNMHLHNNFFHVLAERGLIALLTLIVAFISIIVFMIKRIRSINPEDFFQRALSIGVLFTFIGFLLAGLFEYNFGDAEVKFLLFFFISLPFLSMFTKPIPIDEAGKPGE